MLLTSVEDDSISFRKFIDTVGADIESAPYSYLINIIDNANSNIIITKHNIV